MTPILYEKDEIDFTSQGLGSLVEIYDVDVEEQRNGLLQLTASYPVSGLRYADISVGRIILAKPNQRDDVHAFRIVSTELDISGYSVAIEADSITYDLTHNLVKHLNVSGNGQVFMTALKNAIVNPSIFNFYSDINHVSSTSLDYVNPMEAIMGVKGSFLQIWGGELKRENRRVAMFNRRGRDNVSTFRLGKNISGLKYNVDISSLVTRIIPTKSVQNDDQTTTTLEGTPVDSQYINNYEQIYTLPLEFTDDTIKTVADLNAAAKGWFTESANTGRDKPTVTIDIDVLSLQDSADYQDKFKNLESVSLTDTVTVYVPEYGVNVTAIVNELHYDPILDRVTKMIVGTAKQSFADSSRTQLSDLQDKIISVQNQADAVAVSADGKSTNYYGSVEPSHPQKGDAWFWVNGDKSGIKVFVNGDWVEPVDSDTQEKIAASVTEAVAQANSHTDEVKQSLSTDIDTAKSQAASQASTAEANAKSEAVSQFNRAQNALSAAKTDLTNGIASEASARTQAVAAANSQAQAYVNQAKSDITDTINALSVGGRNYVLNSNVSTTSNITGFYSSVPSSYFNHKKITVSVQVDYDNITSLSDAKRLGVEFVILNKDGSERFIGSWKYPAVGDSFHGRISTTWDLSNNEFKDYPTTQMFQGIYVQGITGTNVSVSKPKLEIGNKATDWTQAPEDVVLDYTTKDNQIKETITQYQDTNDGKVRKAQTDATTALGLVETKVSQTDYDQKTGDLSTKINDVKDTADRSAQTISDIQEADGKRDSRISEVEKTAGEIKSTVSDLSTAQDKQSGYISTLQQKADGFKATVTKVDNLSIGGRNLLLGTRDWTDNTRWNQRGTVTTDMYMGMIIASTKLAWDSPAYNIRYANILQVGKTYTFSTYVRNTSDTDTKVASYYDVAIMSQSGYSVALPAHTDWTRVSVTFDVIGDPTTSGYWLRWESQSDVTNGQIQFAGYKLEQGNLPTDWTPAPEDAITALAQVKITADGISNFVRDSNGNISSEFQTALSKTSIITASTLATSIQTQTATQITQALTDNNKNIIAMINLDTSGVQIAGKNIVLDGDTTVTGDFYAKGGNFKNLNASNLTVGTLNGSQVNITNINANNIVSGAISGANLNINLNTGSVVFQKGRINSSDYTTDINIDQGYISTANGDTRALLTQGKLQLIDPTLFSPQTNPYLEISNNSTIFNGWSALIKARDSLTVSINGYDNRGYDLPNSTEEFVGLSIGKSHDKLMPTKIGGAEQGVIISGGAHYSSSAVNISDYPYIYVGSDSRGISPNGDRIYLNAKAVHIPSAYNVTWSSSANVYIASDGSLYRASSAKKYKQDIKHNVPLSDSKKLLEIPLSTWVDKRQYREKSDETRYFGMIAEDLRDAGLEYLVQYGEDNEVEGINYDRVALLLIPLVKKLKERIEELESEGK